MAIYRNVQMSFWTDTKIADDFTPEEKLLYLYFLTNPHTNLSGCYEISIKQISYETGIKESSIKSALSNLQDNHHVVMYSYQTRELLLINWSKYNWTASDKFRKPLLKEINTIKQKEFKKYLMDVFNGIDNVSLPYQYGSDTTVTVTDTDTVNIKDKRARACEAAQTLSDEFTEIWNLYPRKQGRAKAMEKYFKARKAGTTFDEVKSGVLAYSDYVKRNKIEHEYIKQGSTFFNQSAWSDDWSMNYTRGRPAAKFNNAPERETNMQELELKLLASN